MTPSLTPPSYWKLIFMKITRIICPTQASKNVTEKIFSTKNVNHAHIQINWASNKASNYFTKNNLPRAPPRSQMLWVFSVNYVINSGVQPLKRFPTSFPLKHGQLILLCYTYVQTKFGSDICNNSDNKKSFWHFPPVGRGKHKSKTLNFNMVWSQ